MKDFKFFQKGTTDTLVVDETFITASFNDDIINQYGMLTEEHISQITRRINGGDTNLSLSRQVEHERENLLQMTENERTFFPPIGVTRRDPKWKTLFQEIKKYFKDNYGFRVMFFALTLTLTVGLILGKILNVW
jgi:hypothetical protein